jgi:hypothetical protein
MNTRYASIIFVAVLGLTAASRSPAFTLDQVPYGFHVGTVTATSNGSLKVVRGMDKSDVTWVMHYNKCEELSPDIWSYSGFRAQLDLANDMNCTILVVRFANNKVVDLQLVNRQAVNVIVAGLKPGSTNKSFASK